MLTCLNGPHFLFPLQCHSNLYGDDTVILFHDLQERGSALNSFWNVCWNYSSSFNTLNRRQQLDQSSKTDLQIITEQLI